MDNSPHIVRTPPPQSGSWGPPAEAGVVWGSTSQMQTVGLVVRRALGSEPPHFSPASIFSEGPQSLCQFGDNPRGQSFAAVWNVRLIPGWGLWPEPVWAWSRVSRVSSSPVSEMSPASRISWEMSTNADLGPLAEGGASCSRQSLSPPSPVPNNSRSRSQRALRASPSPPVHRCGN